MNKECKERKLRDIFYYIGNLRVFRDKNHLMCKRKGKHSKYNKKNLTVEITHLKLDKLVPF